MAKRLNLIGPAFEQPEYSLLAREKVRCGKRACLLLMFFLASNPQTHLIGACPPPMTVSGPYEPLQRTALAGKPLLLGLMESAVALRHTKHTCCTG